MLRAGGTYVGLSLQRLGALRTSRRSDMTPDDPYWNSSHHGPVRARTAFERGLFFHLTSGADTYSQSQVADWIAGAGFDAPRARTLPQLPGLALLRGARAS